MSSINGIDLLLLLLALAGLTGTLFYRSELRLMEEQCYWERGMMPNHDEVYDQDSDQ